VSASFPTKGIGKGIGIFDLPQQSEAPESKTGVTILEENLD
jgi:hypothetical protein